MSGISTEFKQYGEILSEQGKVAMAEARKSFYAVIGASDLVLTQASEQGKALRERVRGAAKDAQGIAADLPADAKRISPATLREAVEGYRKGLESYLQATSEQATARYTELTQRGEKVVHEFRKDPLVQRVIIRAESAVDTVEDALEDALDDAGDGVRDAKGDVAKGANKTRGTIRKTAARNTNARKSTTRKPPASKSAGSKA